MVDKSTILTDVFSQIHTILNDNAYQILEDDANRDTVTLRPGENNHWLGAFPDIDVDSKSNYPLGVIHTPNKTKNLEGFRLRTDDITVEVEVFTNKAEYAPRFIQKVENALENNFDQLKCAGLNQLSFDNTSTDMVMRDQIKIHIMTLPITLNFAYEV